MCLWLLHSSNLHTNPTFAKQVQHFHPTSHFHLVFKDIQSGPEKILLETIDSNIIYVIRKMVSSENSNAWSFMYNKNKKQHVYDTCCCIPLIYTNFRYVCIIIYQATVAFRLVVFIISVNISAIASRLVEADVMGRVVTQINICSFPQSVGSFC